MNPALRHHVEALEALGVPYRRRSAGDWVALSTPDGVHFYHRGALVRVVKGTDDADP